MSEHLAQKNSHLHVCFGLIGAPVTDTANISFPPNTQLVYWMEMILGDIAMQSMWNSLVGTLSN